MNDRVLLEGGVGVSKWVQVQGAKIERTFFGENLAEAKSYKWEKKEFPKTQDHSHCIICDLTIPQEDQALYYKSKGGWLCAYCYDHFLAK